MKTKNQIVTFGEIMLRLTPEQKGIRLIKNDRLQMGYAGAESNVAIALSNWGNQVDFISRLPKNSLGDGAINLLREFGVDTASVIRGGDRIGIYFIEGGVSIRPSKVIYDRKHSAIAKLEEGNIDWKTVLERKAWLHLTGITPALSDVCAAETIDAARTAKEMGVNISFDLNYRRKLWEGKDAQPIFDQIIQYTDLLIANTGSLMDVYNIHSSNAADGEAEYKHMMAEVRQRFGVDLVAFTVRDHISASQNRWSGLLYDGNSFESSRTYDLEIVDRFGGGDAFAAGLLHGLNNQYDHAKTIDFAVAASALQQTTPGDLSLSTIAEVEKVMAGHTTGHVER